MARGRIWRWRLGRVALAAGLAVLLLLSVVGVAVWAYSAHYAGRIYAGVTILGAPVGGLTPAEARERLAATLDKETLPYVTLRAGEQSWTVGAAYLGGTLDVDGAVDEAWRLGRTGRFRADMAARLRLLWRGYEIVPGFAVEPGPALIVLRQVARQSGNPAQQAQLWVQGLQARTDTAQVGRELDVAASRDAAETAVRAALGGSHWQALSAPQRALRAANGGTPSAMIEAVAVELVYREVVPPITEVAGAEARAALILSGPLTLTAELPEFTADGGEITLTRRWLVDEALLASWLTAEPGADGAMQVTVDGQQIRAYADELAGQIGRAPREARFDYAGGQVTARSSGQFGYALDVEATAQAIAAACLSTERVVSLAVRVTPPRVSLSDLEVISPLELISEGRTSFQGSTAERAQNIRVATAQFDGVAVPPHSTFSFLRNLGLVTTANGYTESWVISGGRTVLGPGGGVCQVSTTCFRAAFLGGFPIVERWPHSYRVSWYEPPLGLDAAVYSPTTDFKFENDTDEPLLIVTEVNEGTGELVFRFYGRPADRTVRLEGPVESDPLSAPAAVFEQDASLPIGTRVQVEQARDGITATIVRVIEHDGQEIAREELISVYAAWPAQYIVGARPLDAAETPTPEAP